jgi:hypothetical protein
LNFYNYYEKEIEERKKIDHKIFNYLKVKFFKNVVKNVNFFQTYIRIYIQKTIEKLKSNKIWIDGELFFFDFIWIFETDISKIVIVYLMFLMIKIYYPELKTVN